MSYNIEQGRFIEIYRKNVPAIKEGILYQKHLEIAAEHYCIYANSYFMPYQTIEFSSFTGYLGDNALLKRQKDGNFSKNQVVIDDWLSQSAKNNRAYKFASPFFFSVVLDELEQWIETIKKV